MGTGTPSIAGSGDGGEAGVWEIVAVTLAEIMADTGHYSIDSTTVRAHVSAAGGKGGLIDALLAARGAGSIFSEEGALAANGCAAETKGVFIYDRIITEPEHRRKGLGHALMMALRSTRQQLGRGPSLIFNAGMGNDLTILHGLDRALHGAALS
jgi:GNAT superfamily N-acetyltransferase